ncbi:MAG: type 1 glutamine amidotransferase [Nocardioides sp.]
MRALVIQHDHVSPLGPIGDRLSWHGYELVFQQVLSEDQIPEPRVAATFPPATEFDVIVSMGATFSVYDAELIGPWLAPELALLRDADTHGIPVLGICFGGQLIAAAHGGSVARSPHPEIGWATVESDDPSLISTGPWFEWHYDRWTLPPDAVEVARNGCASQAFVLRRNLAVQFHPELTSAMLAGWLGYGGLAEVQGMGIDADELTAATEQQERAAIARAHSLVDAFLAGPGSLTDPAAH